MPLFVTFDIFHSKHLNSVPRAQNNTVVKVVLWNRGGAHLTKPGWSKPHTHSNPTNLALFRHKITVYRFNHGGSYCCRGAQMGAGGAPLVPLTLTTGKTQITALYSSSICDISMSTSRNNKDPKYRICTVLKRLNQCSRIRILCFFLLRFQKKTWLFTFFEMTYQKVVKSL